jgi:hypothetical protein
VKTGPLRLRVEVETAPSPYLLRAAIARRLAGHPVAAGPERAVAEAVARAVDVHAGRERPWR